MFNRKGKKIALAALAIIVVAAAVVLVVNRLQKQPIVYAERIDTVMIDSLCFFYPVKYNSIDLYCGSTPPEQSDTCVLFTAAAAFTLNYLDTFCHSNIICSHASAGQFYQSPSAKRCNGAFVYSDGQFQFVSGKEKVYGPQMQQAAQQGGCGFAQEMMIHQGSLLKTRRPDGNLNKFRALCALQDSTLCVVQSNGIVQFGRFKQQLLDAGVAEALYLDMGSFDYGWYRDSIGQVHELSGCPHSFYTNWITFYR